MPISEPARQPDVTAGLEADVRASQPAERAPNGDDFDVKIKASTETVARDGGLVPLSAWEDGGLEAFRQNPAVLWAHDHTTPAVARAVHTEIQGPQRSSAGDEPALVEWWDFHEETELSRQLKVLYEGGFMRAASVGFVIHDARDPTQDELETHDPAPAWVAVEAELLETSAVNVGSDPKALAAIENAVRRGADEGLATGAVEDELRALRRRCRAGDEMACSRLRRSAQHGQDDTVTIPLRPGETAEQALRRYVDRQIERRLEEERHERLRRPWYPRKEG